MAGEIRYSMENDRADQQPLDGAATDRPRSVWLTEHSHAKRVVWKMDDEVILTQTSQPWELPPDPFALVPGGAHRLVAAVTVASGNLVDRVADFALLVPAEEPDGPTQVEPSDDLTGRVEALEAEVAALKDLVAAGESNLLIRVGGLVAYDPPNLLVAEDATITLVEG